MKEPTMPSETDLLRSLDPEPPQPSTVDITRAITAGRRRRTHRAVGYAGVAAVTTLAVAGTAIFAGTNRDQAPPSKTVAAGPSKTAKPKGHFTIPGTTGWQAPAATVPSSCTIERLTVPDGVKMALISGADSTGSYLVGRSYPKGGYQAVIWHNGKGAKVNLPGDLEEDLQGVNASGTAVGWSYQGKSDADIGPVPYAYANGKVVKLKGGHGQAYAINDAGAIVGDVGDHAAVWTSPGEPPVLLPVPDGTQKSTAVAIDEDGTVVGSLDLKVPYVWFADGAYQALPLPLINGKKAVSARVFEIRNGWAIGVADASELARSGKAKGAQGNMSAVRWNVRTGETQVVTGWDAMAENLNAQGWEIGITDQGRPALLAGGKRIALPELAKHDAGTLSTIPKTISDDGKIISGQSDDAADVIHAVIWRCL
jgi:uncharacterized membrane protein